LNQKKFRQFEAIFHPKSVAVVGASSNRMKDGAIFFQNLLNAGFKGKVYPVNSAESEILGLKSYPKVSAIPGPVDYVLVAVPARLVLEVIEDCVAKGVKAVQIYTAGFREAGTQQGRWLEEEIVKRAQEGGFRLIGPNCLGLYNPSINLNLWGLPPAEAGSVAIISQSGGVAGRATLAASARGVQFSKVVSYGNGADLDSTDFLEYFAADPDTRIIGIYIEGVRDGQRLFQLLQQTGKTKPVVVWKGGKTEAGAEVAMAHTGSLAASNHVWEALSRQAGMTKVDNQDDLVGTLLAFYYLGEFRGRSAGILCGLTRGGGGESVSATDTCSSLGLTVPPFSPQTRRKLAAILPWPGTILRNALDVSIWKEAETVRRALDAIAADPGIDLIIICERIHMLLDRMPKEAVQAINQVFIQLRKQQPKPVVVISPPGFPTTSEQWQIEQELAAARIPVYSSLEEAAKAIARVSQYFAWRAGLNED
jgi:acyl-CoA synthetase (NDP forming)